MLSGESGSGTSLIRASSISGGCAVLRVRIWRALSAVLLMRFSLLRFASSAFCLAVLSSRMVFRAAILVETV